MHHRIYPKPFTGVNEHWVFDRLLNATPHTSNYKDVLIQNDSNYFHKDILDLQAEWYEHFAIDIVTETVYNYPYTQITEKTLRPILCKRMFIIIGAPKTLSWLHSKGFKTFNPFINEKYDSIINPNDRMFFLLNEIDRLCELPISTVRDAITDYSNILEDNFTLLKNIVINEFEELEDKFSHD